MIDFKKIIGFDWDEGNARKNAEKHGVSQTEAEQVFLNQPLLVKEDLRYSPMELRWHALGSTDTGRWLQMTFTLRDHNTRIRVISARTMSRKERKYYENHSKSDSEI